MHLVTHKVELRQAAPPLHNPQYPLELFWFPFQFILPQVDLLELGVGEQVDPNAADFVFRAVELLQVRTATHIWDLKQPIFGNVQHFEFGEVDLHFLDVIIGCPEALQLDEAIQIHQLAQPAVVHTQLFQSLVVDALDSSEVLHLKARFIEVADDRVLGH